MIMRQPLNKCICEGLDSETRISHFFPAVATIVLKKESFTL